MRLKASLKQHFILFFVSKHADNKYINTNILFLYIIYILYLYIMSSVWIHTFMLPYVTDIMCI